MEHYLPPGKSEKVLKLVLGLAERFL